jgi:hypothetical protein
VEGLGRSGSPGTEAGECGIHSATYVIEFLTNNQNWSVIEDGIVGEGGAVERLYSKTDFPTGFFRVERRDQ